MCPIFFCFTRINKNTQWIQTTIQLTGIYVCSAKKKTLEKLKCPAESNHTANISDVYNDSAALLTRFRDAEAIPIRYHKKLVKFLMTAPDAGKTFLEKKVSWHSSCKGLITESKYERVTAKRKKNEAPDPAPVTKKTTRSQILNNSVL